MDNWTSQLNQKGNDYLNHKDYISAYKYFSEAARLGDSYAIYNVGFCCFHGYGTPKNYTKAFQILKKFVNINSLDLSINSSYLCGLMLDSGGYGITSNKSEAAEYYCKAAEKGHCWSLLMIGKLSLEYSNLSNAKEYIEQAMEFAPNDYELQNYGRKLLKAIKLKKFVNYL